MFCRQGQACIEPRPLKLRVRRDQKRICFMKKIIRNTLSLFMLVLSACNLNPFSSPDNTALLDTPVLRLTVQTRNGASTFSQAGEVINYDYVITNTGSSPLAGPAVVSDAPRQVTCPEVSATGNGDIYLDLNETITCTSSYTITAADVSTGSVTTLATANVGGVASNQAGVTLTRAAPVSSITLTKTASSQTYGQVGQTITYNYTITNTGTTQLGPAQFVITDNKLAALAAGCLAPSSLPTKA
jgi:uncharacterized repeat protein (TIGR01451 family)